MGEGVDGKICAIGRLIIPVGVFFHRISRQELKVAIVHTKMLIYFGSTFCGSYHCKKVVLSYLSLANTFYLSASVDHAKCIVGLTGAYEFSRLE